jgi:hypothetical protein
MMINHNQKGMRTLNYFLSAFLASGSLQAQTGALESYLLMIPSDITPVSNPVKVYDVTLEWQNKENFYSKIPADQRDLARWLVSDAAQMQGLAYYIFDSLEFNREFYPTLLNDYDIEFEDWVTFSSRYQKLIWSGVTRHNGEPCAMVRFESLYNPVKSDNNQMNVSGRSLYYGEMWIFLTDKQVEYTSMVEDVVFELKSPVFPDGQLVDLQREVIFNKSDLL